MDAFAYYYKLGEKRSLESVSKEFRISHMTAKRWSIDFEWQKRIAEVEAKSNQRAEEKLITDAAREKARSLKLVCAIEDIAEIKIKNTFGERTNKKIRGKIEPKSTKDLVELWKVKQLLIGEPTGIEENRIIVQRETITEPENADENKD